MAQFDLVGVKTEAKDLPKKSELYRKNVTYHTRLTRSIKC